MMSSRLFIGICLAFCATNAQAFRDVPSFQRPHVDPVPPSFQRPHVDPVPPSFQKPHVDPTPPGSQKPHVDPTPPGYQKPQVLPALISRPLRSASRPVIPSELTKPAPRPVPLPASLDDSAAHSSSSQAHLPPKSELLKPALRPHRHQ